MYRTSPIRAKIELSLASAYDDYGVVCSIDGVIDHSATAALRADLRAGRGELPFFDRGPGYRELSGRDFADVDRV